MSKVIVRSIPSLLVLGAGITALVYGGLFSVQQVTHEEEVSLPPPFPFLAAPGLPFEESGLPPGFAPPSIKERVTVSEATPEWVLVREITFGGVIRLATGELQRTYSGAAPKLCPT